MVTTVLIGLGAFLCGAGLLHFLHANARCPRCRQLWPDHACPAMIAKGSGVRVCQVCGTPLAAGAVKTHYGKWLCPRCKGDQAT